jgi:hypothetical protein
MTDWKKRLTSNLEPILRDSDPRPRISAYHDMPYAIFQYPPEEEWALRGELEMLKTRLEQEVGKRVLSISLAECLSDALLAEGLDADTLAGIEASVGLAPTLETIHEILADRQPLDQLVAHRIPPDADPLHDIVFIVRAGALFPVYRTSSLLEQLQGRVRVPAVLFYPGDLEGAAGLRFMGVLDAEHNYRPRIF